MPGNETEIARIQLRVDTLANWQANNPILVNGEIALIQDSNPPQFKRGNSTSTRFNSLPLFTVLGPADYVFMGVANSSTNPASSALNDKTNNRKTVWFAYTPGTYTNFNNVVLQADEVAFLILDRSVSPQTTTKQTVDLATPNKATTIANNLDSARMRSLVRYTIPEADAEQNPNNLAFEYTDNQGVYSLSCLSKVSVILASGDIIDIAISDSVDITQAIEEVSEFQGWWAIVINEGTFTTVPPEEWAKIYEAPDIFVFYVNDQKQVTAYSFVTHNNKVTIV